MRFVSVKGSFDICTADVVFWVCFVAHKKQELTSADAGHPLTPPAAQDLPFQSFQAGMEPPSPVAVLSFPQALLAFTAHLLAFPFLTSMLSEPSQVYLFPEPLPGLPLAQCAGASCATAAFWVTCISEQMGVCCLMVQRLKPT